MSSQGERKRKIKYERRFCGKKGTKSQKWTNAKVLFFSPRFKVADRLYQSDYQISKGAGTINITI